MPVTPSPAVLRAGELLGHLARHPSDAFSVSELARTFEFPRPTCDSILQALAHHAFVVRRPDLRYELGVGCLTLGDAARAASALLRAASVEADGLSRALGLSAATSVRVGGEVRVVEAFDVGAPFSFRVRAGESVPLVPPFGAVFVAWDEDDAEQWLRQAPDDRSRWQRALDCIRERGYSVSLHTERQADLERNLELLAQQPDALEGQRERQELIHALQHSEYLPTELDGDTLRLASLAAPVFDGAGRVAASLQVLGPNYELTNEQVRKLGEEVTRAAQRASASPAHATGGGR